MKPREKRFFSKENLGKIIIELKWKHKEDEGWNVINIPAKDLEKKIEELKKDGWKEEELKVVIK